MVKRQYALYSTIYIYTVTHSIHPPANTPEKKSSQIFVKISQVGYREMKFFEFGIFNSVRLFYYEQFVPQHMAKTPP